MKSTNTLAIELARDYTSPCWLNRVQLRQLYKTRALHIRRILELQHELKKMNFIFVVPGTNRPKDFLLIKDSDLPNCLPAFTPTSRPLSRPNARWAKVIRSLVRSRNLAQ